MAKTIMVCGYGPGISDAIARKFGAEGFQVALVARGEDKVQRAAASLRDAGVKAQGFACDLGDAAAVQALVGKVRAALGSVTVIHWNAYAGVAGDLLTAGAAEFQKGMDVSVTGLIAAVQSALGDMKSQPGAGAVLVTGGGFAYYDPQVDAMAVQFNAMGLSVAKAAQHKLVGLLHNRLAREGVYVGEVVVLGMVKGTAFDQGHATLEPSAVAGKFWEIYGARAEASVQVR